MTTKERVGMRRYSVGFLIGSMVVLLAGVLQTALSFMNQHAHPEWSAPASLALVTIVPYLIVSGLLFLVYRRAVRD